MLDSAIQGLHAWFSKFVYMPSLKAHMQCILLFLMYGAKEFMHGKGSREHVMHTVHMSFMTFYIFK